MAEASLADIVRAIDELHETVRDGGGAGGGAIGAAADTPGGAGAQAKGSGGGGIPSSLKTLGGLATIGTAAKAFGAGIDSFAGAGGDAASASGAFGRSVARTASNIPGLGSLTGASRSTSILDRAEGSVSGVAASLAKAGIDLSPQQLKSVVGRELQISKRVQTATEAVGAEVDRQGKSVRQDAAPDIPGLADLIGMFDRLASSVGRAANEFEARARRAL